MFTYYLWIKSIKTGSVYFATFTALSYFYMVSAWGGYVFITNLIPLHVFALILMNRFSHRIYVAYNTFFIVGLICSMQVMLCIIDCIVLVNWSYYYVNQFTFWISSWLDPKSNIFGQKSTYSNETILTFKGWQFDKNWAWF